MLSIKSLTKSAFFVLATLMLFFAQSAYSQTPTTGFDPNNLSNVKIDELSDEQVLSIVKQGEGAGFTFEQAQAIAISRGLPASEAKKMKERILKIQSASEPAFENVTDISDQNSLEKNTELLPKKKIDTTGNNSLNNVSIYGQGIFRNGDIKVFDKSLDAKAPSNYVIGTGDELALSVFGNSYYNEILKVDAKGAISPNQMGPIYIKGLTFEKAKSLIRSKFNQYFDLSSSRLEITLSYSRSITVNIVGEVLKPGSYKIPAINTVFNALILAGGPNDIGTLREVQVRRNGKIVKTLDVYEFLLNPNSTQDYFLEDNDYVVINSSKKLVTIKGEIKRPSIYELKESEDLMALIKFAGGVKSTAYLNKIQIRRSFANETNIIELDLDSLIKNNKSYAIVNGDIVDIKSKVSDINNKVKIYGAVNYPGDYNFFDGMRVYDLIKNSGDIKIDADLRNAFIIRTKADQTKEFIRINVKEVMANKESQENILLEKLDELSILSQKDFVEVYPIKIYGSVKSILPQTFIPGMTLGDAIRQAGGFKIEAENLRIEISRLSYFTPNYVDGDEVKVLIERIDLGDKEPVLNSAQAQYLLQPFDEIFVRSIPNFDAQKVIEMRGEVKYPGYYPLLSKDEKVTSIIKRAGGLTKYAYLDAATFYRPDLPGGFIVFKLRDVLKNENSKYNYTLQKGDIINFPTVIDFVGIRGSSIGYLSVLDRSQVNAPYIYGKRAKYYINNFGNGFTKESWKKKTYVVQPNAKINRTRNFVIFKIYPKVTKGSTIYVVNKPIKEKKIKRPEDKVDWNKVVADITTKITGLATFFLLLRQL